MCLFSLDRVWETVGQQGVGLSVLRTFLPKGDFTKSQLASYGFSLGSTCRLLSINGIKLPSAFYILKKTLCY